MMRVNRDRPAHEVLQQAVHMGCVPQVLPPCHQRYTLRCVVVGDAEVVAGWNVLAGENDVAEGFRIAA